jgi:predicted metal-binding membrane protein
MSAAMMLPLVWGHVSLIAQRSLWHRRHRAIALFIGTYLAIWMIYGVLAGMALRWSAGILLLVAAIWQLTPWKRFALAACHRSVPLAPFGWKADRDCLRYGIHVARNCLLSCWALMLVCTANHGTLWLMIALTAFVLKERTVERPRHTRFALALVTCAVVATVVPAQ